MSVKNINSLKYFLDRWETVDPEYNYTVPYHESIDPNFTSFTNFRGGIQELFGQQSACVGHGRQTRGN